MVMSPQVPPRRILQGAGEVPISWIHEPSNMQVRRLALPKQDRIMLPAGLDILGRPKGENRIAHGLQPWEDGPERNRPERAAEGRSLFPKITFVESDSMAFQKLTKLFLIRKFAVMLGLIGNVGGNGLYARLAD